MSVIKKSKYLEIPADLIPPNLAETPCPICKAQVRELIDTNLQAHRLIPAGSLGEGVRLATLSNHDPEEPEFFVFAYRESPRGYFHIVRCSTCGTIDLVQADIDKLF